MWKLFLLEKIRSAFNPAHAQPHSPLLFAASHLMTPIRNPFKLLVTPSNANHNPYSAPRPQPLTPPWPWPWALWDQDLSPTVNPFSATWSHPLWQRSSFPLITDTNPQPAHKHNHFHNTSLLLILEGNEDWEKSHKWDPARQLAMSTSNFTLLLTTEGSSPVNL